VKSIRTHLLAWLVAALASSGLALVGATYSYAVKEFDSVSDEELKQIAYALRLTADGAESDAFREANPGFLFSARAYGANGHLMFERGLIGIRFTGPMSTAEGFTNVETPGHRWRVFTHVMPQGAIQVAQPEEVRRSLARDLALRMIKPIAFAIPLIALLVWWFLERGLAPLRAASELVRRRAPEDLEPLPRGVEPQELQPLLDAIDDLMRRVSVALEAQRRFVADAAHELRSPLTALKLQVQLAERAPDEVARASAIEALRRGVDRGSHLVEQLLSLARVDRPSEVPEACDLAALARDTVSDYALRSEVRRVDIGADAGGAVFVAAPADALRSLMSNLIDNALRYTPDGGTITVSVASEGSAVRLAVVDSGPGIPANERERVFERFYRGAGAVAVEGSGLGLAIVKAVAERYGASVSLADANPGQVMPGLRVCVEFPAGPGPRGAGPAELSPSSLPPA